MRTSTVGSGGWEAQEPLRADAQWSSRPRDGVGKEAQHSHHRQVTFNPAPIGKWIKLKFLNGRLKKKKKKFQAGNFEIGAFFLLNFEFALFEREFSANNDDS